MASLEELSEMEAISCDFHVHTPVSTDFVTGDDPEKARLDILREAVDNKINVIAICDHNTVEGYYDFKDLEKKFQSEEETLSKYNAGKEPLERVRDITRLFKKIVILPGMEYHARPGIHLLLIFNPIQEKSDIDAFVQSLGPPKDPSGIGQSDVLDVLERVRTSQIDVIVIAAHCDSDSGLYNCTEKNRFYRRQILMDSVLSGIEFNSTVTRDKISNLLKEYGRTSPIAFIQSSDFHNREDEVVGQKKSYILGERGTYDTIQEAFRNPVGYIFAPERPGVAKALDTVCSDSGTFVIANLEDSEILARAIAAIANQGSGQILIGINQMGNRIGVSKDVDVKRIFREKILPSVQPTPRVHFRTYPYGDKSFFYLISIVGSTKSIYFVKGNELVYILKDHKPKEIDNIVEIHRILEEKIREETESYLSVRIRKIDRIKSSLDKLGDELLSINVIQKIDSESIPLRDVIDAEPAILLPEGEEALNELRDREEIYRIIREDYNGYTSGNLIALSDVQTRLNESYLRFGAPYYKLEEDIIDNLVLYEAQDESILITETGASYLVQKKARVIKTPFPYMVGKPLLVSISISAERTSNYSILMVLGLLKSSLALWYNYIIHEDVNYFPSKSLYSLPMFKAKTEEEKYKTENIVNEIIAFERDYVSREAQIRNNIKRSSSKKEREKAKGRLVRKMNEHNDQAGKMLYRLDNAIFDLYDLEGTERDLIRRSLERSGVFIPKP